jgi:hypothetical protein
MEMMCMSTKTVLAEVTYMCGNFCWLNGTIERSNKLTGHHIKPLRRHGPTTVNNIAPLVEDRHRWFNLVERDYPELAEEVNNYFRQYHGEYPEEIEWRINQIFALVDPEQRGKHKRKHRH